MKLYFERNLEERVALPMPDGGSPTVTIPGATCDHCRKPLEVVGRHPERDDRSMRSRAHCAACDDHQGLLVVEFSTLFGAEEDDRVLNGRPRVY
jgi:hypothetical protein